LLGFIIRILCYVAQLNETFFHLVCKQSVIYFVFRVGGCVRGAVFNISVSEILHTQRYCLLLIVSKTIKLAGKYVENQTSSPPFSTTSFRKAVSPLNTLYIPLEMGELVFHILVLKRCVRYICPTLTQKEIVQLLFQYLYRAPFIILYYDQ
jgi:hypothetical protein